jgi:hypothetical protein
MKWFRMWIDILDDPKLAVSVTAAETFRVTVLLMAYARELNNAGKIDQPDDVIAWRLRITIPELKKHLKHLSDLKIIELKPELHFINWAKRQFLSDSSTERVKRFRVGKRNVSKLFRETPPDTDTETDTDTENKTPLTPLCPTSKTTLDGHVFFDRFWRSYPKRIGKGAAEKAFKKIKPSESLLQTMILAIENFTESEQWKKDGGQYIPNPATWLNQKRWEDEVPPEDKISKLNPAQQAVVKAMQNRLQKEKQNQEQKQISDEVI